jgi:polyhydroxyalkanoate synthase
MITDHGRRQFGSIDRSLRAILARLTQDISPYALSAAYVDWGVHFARSPGAQMDVAGRLVLADRHRGGEQPQRKLSAVTGL